MSPLSMGVTKRSVASDRNADSDEPILPHKVRTLIGRILKFADICSQIPRSDISSHSLRSGGVAAPFHSGVDIREIQKMVATERSMFPQMHLAPIQYHEERMCSYDAISPPLIRQLKTVIVPPKTDSLLRI